MGNEIKKTKSGGHTTGTGYTADQKIDVTKTKTCPYCGILFESPREVLMHIFTFHSG